MNFELAESVLGVLRSTTDARIACLRLGRFSEAEWQRAGFWLDASGLTLHLWDALSRHRHTDVLPQAVQARLRENSSDNRRRSEAMFAQFSSINEALEGAGIEYAALKGFSLTPDFCPDPSLRFQMDFDYLVRPEAVNDVAAALRPLGYFLVGEEPFEAQFSNRTDDCRKHEDLYRPPSAISLEFHYSLFDRPEFGFSAPVDSLSTRHRIEQFGRSYSVLDQPEQFLNRVLNAFQDVFLFTVRLSSLLEIVHFIHRYREDAALWQRLRRRAGQWGPRIGPMVGLVLALAGEIYGSDPPPELREWTLDACPPSALLWVRCYGKRWALHPFPGCKLSMLIAHAFMDERHWWAYTRRNIVPLQLRRRLPYASTGPLPPRPPGYRFRRAWFHLREAFHVGWEIPGWAWTLRELPPR